MTHLTLILYNLLILLKVNTIKMQNFVWLIFPGNDVQKIQFTELAIPYDCEFIVIQSKNSTAFTLTELYTVKNKFFSLDYGTWTRDFGLKTTNGNFYSRRTNLQRTELRVLTHPEGEVTDTQRKR